MRLNEDGKTVCGYGRSGSGASVRSLVAPSVKNVWDVLDERMLEMGLNKEDYWWYRDLLRYGTVPHSGFGLVLTA